jgi:hypothetical protein
MRTAITIGIHHGGDIVEIIAAPPTPLDEQRRAFKAMRAEVGHDKFESIEFWDSGAGRVLRHRFKASTPASAEVTHPESQPTPPPESKLPPVPEGTPPVPAELPQPPSESTDEGPDDVDGFQVRKPRKKKST